MAETLFSFEAIGTHWQIEVSQQLSPAEQQQLLSTIHQRIDAFDLTYSRFRPDSLVSLMGREGGSYPVPLDAPPMLQLFYDLEQLSDGLFTPLIGQSLVDAGYDASYSLKAKPQVSKPPRWSEVITYDGNSLKLEQPVLLDFGAGGKGYLIDILSAVLDSQSLSDYTINAGGDIIHRSTEPTPYRVGLENPSNTQQVIGVATITNQSLCGSAGNRRAWDEYHHILNPRTLKSPHHILATWVIADTTMLADALSTALFFVTPEQLATQYTFEYATLTADYALHRSPAFPATVFTV